MPTNALHDSHHAIMKYVQLSIHSLSSAFMGVMKLSSMKSPANAPTERTNRLEMKPLGPVTKTKSPSSVAMVKVICEMYLMPRLTPVRADPVKRRVRTEMTRICRMMVESMPKIVLRPSPICEAPRPRDVVVPKSVAMMVRMSIALPTQPSTNRPRTGRSIVDTSAGRPFRWVE